MKMTQDFDIEGKICVITGAGGALCGCIAEAIADAGVKVAVLDINSEKAEETASKIVKSGGQARAFTCDVLDRTQLEEIYDAVLKEFGKPDFLINGAGGNHPDGSTDAVYHDDDPNIKTFNDLPYEGMLHSFKLNYFGTILPTQVFSRGMLEKKHGSIINFASVSSLNPLTKVVCYSSAKAAIANFTKWAAVHYSKQNVRVNAIAPGFIMTEQLKFLHLDGEGNYTQRAKEVLGHTPFNRYGEPEELIGAVRWLLSDAASFTTGSIISVDGGFTSFSI